MPVFSNSPEGVDPDAETLSDILDPIDAISLPEKTIKTLKVFRTFGLPETNPDPNVIECRKITYENLSFTLILTAEGNLYMEMTDLKTNQKTYGDIMQNDQEMGDLPAIYAFLDFATYQQGVIDLLNFIMEEQSGPFKLNVSWQHTQRMGVAVQTEHHWGTIKWNKDDAIEITHGSQVARRKNWITDPYYTKLLLRNDGNGMALKTQTAKVLEWIEAAMGKKGRLLILKHRPLSESPSKPPSA